jgi:hypothetical protein
MTDDPYERLLREHAEDLADEDDEPEPETNIMNPDQIINAAAVNVANRDRIPFAEAQRRVRAAAARPLGNVGSVQLSGGGPVRTIPPLPAPGAVTDVRSARLYLSAHHPAWANMSNEEQHTAALVLRNMNVDIRAQLSRVPSDGRQTVVLALFPGATRTARARSFLTATEEGFAALPNEAQHERALALRTRVNVIDDGGAR